MSASTQFLSRNCPTCEANKGTIEIASSPAAENLSFEELQPYWNGFFKEKIFFSYFRCQCGLLYCPQYFTSEQLNQLYANMPDNTADLPINALKKTQNSYFNFLKKHADLKGSYLEIGPDIGLFTENCIKQGDFQSYWLFEPNKKVWTVLQERLGANEVHLNENMFDFDTIPDNSISIVVAIHVLDHLLDPLATLKKLKQKLSKNAQLLFVTHDESSLLSKVFKQKWPPYCLQHPQLFNPSSITTLLKEAGFDLVSLEKSYNHFPLIYLLKHGLWALGIKNIKLPEINILQLPLKLGNMITLVESK